MEKAITFENKNGEKLFGIVHIPDNENPGAQKVGINLLNPGIKYRVAPNRLNVKLARKLCEGGYYVLRFDPAGIGDSEGELPENISLLEIWSRIQTGLFVDDTLAANDFFIEKFAINRLVMMGSCGGAITSLLASKKDHRVGSLCLVDIPIFLGSAKMTFADIVVESGERADCLFSEYLKRLKSPKYWFRFFTFKTDFRALWKILNMKWREKVGRFGRSNRLPPDIGELCREKNLNRLFFDCFADLVQGQKPVLFVLAENDHGTELFHTYVLNGCFKDKFESPQYGNLIEYFMVKNANHVYTLIESQESLINKILDWTHKATEHQQLEFISGRDQV